MNQPPSTRPEWHVPPDVAQRYVGLTLDSARAASVEQHVLTCTACRAQLAACTADDLTTAAELDALWLEVIDAVDRPRAGPVGSFLHRLRVPDDVARVIAATPALRLSWIASVAVVLSFAVANALRVDGSDALFLVLAPIIPLAGIGTAYGARTDPLHELSRATPMPGSRIFLLRSLAVLLTAIPLTFVAALALGVDGVGTMAWLLPALGLVGATMGLSTWMAPRVAASVAGLGWFAVLLGSWVRSARVDVAPLASTLAFRPAGQLAFAVLAVVGAAVFALRLTHLDEPGAPGAEAS